MSPGKLAAQVAHCSEAYWTNLIKRNAEEAEIIDSYMGDHYVYRSVVEIRKNVFEDYLNGRFVKTVCEARNKPHLLKARDMANEMGFAESNDYGLIYDACFTELTPEEENGTTLTGIWFRPLPDEIAHYISKKYQLYR